MLTKITDVWSTILAYYQGLPFWEWLAVISALMYVVFAAKEHIWCWPAAIISTIIYTVIFYDVYLWMDSLLQIYYLAMAIFGWYCWHQGNKDTGSGCQISSWSARKHGVIVMLLALMSVCVGWVMANFTPTHFPYLDAATTVFAVFATYLVTQKILENWLYWVVIDLVSIYLYVEKDLMPTALLFVLYVGMAIYGYCQWLQHYKRRETTLVNATVH